MTEKTMFIGDLFRMTDQFHDSALLHFAHASGIFEMLGTPQASDAVAVHMGWQTRKTRIFLDNLAALGLLTKSSDGDYQNTAIADERLVKSKPGYMGGVVEHQRLQWEAWARIGDVLAAQGPLPWQQERRLEEAQEANDAFHQAMRNLARANAPAFLELPLFSGAPHVIDLAGGHGTYLAALAQKNPKLTGEVWDRVGAQQLANATFEEYGCAERCRFHVRDIGQPANFDGVSADVVMLNDCLHYFDMSGVASVLECAVAMLGGRGALVVSTRVLNSDAVTPAEAAGFSMHMMLNTANGELHVTDELVAQMERLGLTIARYPLDPLGRYTILVGTIGL
jgi:O-methyltransferase domain/Dimerisation domain